MLLALDVWMPAELPPDRPIRSEGVAMTAPIFIGTSALMPMCWRKERYSV